MKYYIKDGNNFDGKIIKEYDSLKNEGTNYILFSSIDEAIYSMSGYCDPVELPNGKIIVPYEINQKKYTEGFKLHFIN